MKTPKEYRKDYKGAAIRALQGVVILAAGTGFLLLLVALVEGVA